MQPGHMAYDRAITVFSPDGRLFQVEYAREAVKRGTTTVGIKYKNGVVLLVEKRVNSRLVEPDSIEKVFKIDRNVGCATSGLVADARALVDKARVECQTNRFNYGEEMPIETLVKRLCDFKQSYTQYGGVRPFGTALLVAGVDEYGAHLYETDPSGAMTSYKAVGIGSGRNEVTEIFEEKYKEGMTAKQAIILGVNALQKANEEEFEFKNVEIANVSEDRGFYNLDQEEIRKYATSKN